MHKLLVLIAYAHLPLISDHVDVTSRTGDLIYDMSLYQYPYFVYSRAEMTMANLYICADRP